MIYPIEIVFGSMTESELDVMLTAFSEGMSTPTATKILNQRKSKWRRTVYCLTVEQAKWLASEMQEEASRVSEAISESAGRAFEKAAEKLLIEATRKNQPNPQPSTPSKE